MGQNLSYALVSMTNKDVYYIDETTAEFLMDLLGDRAPANFVRFTDAKSGAQVTLSVSHISSIVIRSEV